MTSKARTLLFIAECLDSSGDPKRIWVHKQGRSYYLSGSTPAERPHLCHPSVGDHEGIKREILLVYHFTVENVSYPHQLGDAGKS